MTRSRSPAAVRREPPARAPGSAAEPGRPRARGAGCGAAARAPRAAPARPPAPSWPPPRALVIRTDRARRLIIASGEDAPMRYVVLGAGTVGCTVGGLLFDGGHDVLLVARGSHGAAMRERGLRLATPSRVLTLDIPVVTDPARSEEHTSE